MHLHRVRCHRRHDLIVTSGDALTVSGADDLRSYLARVITSTSDVDDAFDTHGRDVVTAAQGLAPVRTGGLRAALSHTHTATTLTVTAGSDRAPHAYTMHATKLGLVNGGMTFRVPAHTRRGSQVKAYRRRAAVPNRPYLYQAWEQKLTGLRDRVTTALADALGRG